MHKTTIVKTIKNLSKSGLSRITLYLNIERVTQIYHQNGGPESIDFTEELESGVSGNLQAVVASVGGTILSNRGTTMQVSISPVLMVLILEEHKRLGKLLLDPSIVKKPQGGALLKYIETSQMVPALEKVRAKTSGLPKEIADLVQGERERQMGMYRWLGLPEKNTLVWVWRPLTNHNLVAIALSDFVSTSNFMSFAPHQPTGVIGLFENDIQNVRFISPLWIWHEQ